MKMGRLKELQIYNTFSLDYHEDMAEGSFEAALAICSHQSS